MLNQVNLQGRLVADSEVGMTVHTSNGDVDKYRFTLASQDDEGKKATHFIYCEAWGRTGEFISKWFKKGQMIFLTGKLTSYRDYEELDGATRVVVTVQRAEFPSQREDKNDAPIEVNDEDIPF